MHDNLYTIYKLDRKGLTGKQVSRISTPGRTTKVLIPSTRVRCCRRDQDFRTLVLPLIPPNLPDLPNRSQEQLRNNPEKDSHDQYSRKVTQGLGQRILDSKTPIVQLAEGASWTGCTDQLARSGIWISPTRRIDQLDRASRPTRLFNELD
ncbi:hypothetical protein F2Q69_00059127 [Brassica cretica]|uniref:Uncharacterized protein n=1 Tax=Brassica cretica TaxID=69181 RepID=A0A8S9RE37_BRACR|nr:hypothetical protein F2Q69_00059127 [Brassica cretica]